MNFDDRASFGQVSIGGRWEDVKIMDGFKSVIPHIEHVLYFPSTWMLASSVTAFTNAPWVWSRWHCASSEPNL